MKKKAFLMLPCIAAVAIATFVGKKTFESSALERNNILLENVEALSQGDDGDYDASDCNSGEPRYSFVKVASGKSQTRTHYSGNVGGNDGIDDGIDVIIDMTFIQCIAEGSGTYKGNNYRYNTGMGTPSYVKCNGPQGHYNDSPL